MKPEATDLTVTIGVVDHVSPVLRRIGRKLWWMRYGALVTATLVIALVVLAFVAGFLLAANVDAKRHHAVTAGESISVAAVAFGATGTVSYTSADPVPWAEIRCDAGFGLDLDTWLDVFRGNVTFTAGPTTSWSSGPASCLAILWHFDDGSWTELARTTFEVTP